MSIEIDADQIDEHVAHVRRRDDDAIDRANVLENGTVPRPGADRVKRHGDPQRKPLHGNAAVEYLIGRASLPTRPSSLPPITATPARSGSCSRASSGMAHHPTTRSP